MSGMDWRQAGPVLCLLGAALGAVGVDLFGKRSWTKSAIEWIAYIGVIAAIVLLRWVEGGTLGPIFGGALVADGLFSFLSLAILIATALTILVSMDSIAAKGVLMAEYVALLLTAAAGMLLLVMSHDLITMFLSIEILSLALYVLCGITRTDKRSNEAAMKYFILGAFSTGFLLYGMTFLYGAGGSVFFDRLHLGLHSEATGLIAVTGVGLTLAGFAFKIGAAPFHFWVPDVYEGAPMPVTAFMSVAVKAAGFGALVRLLIYVLPNQVGVWKDLVFGLAVLTLIAGNLGALRQVSVKRMLAYSSIAHTGYALLGLVAAAPLHSQTAAGQGPAAAVFYTFVYTVMTMGAFLFLMWAGKSGKDAETYDDLSGLAKRRPWAAAIMTIFMISLAGLPPTAGFFGKFLLFKSAVDAGYIALSVFGILMSVISVYYYLRVIVVMYMHDPVETPGEAAKADGMEKPPDFNIGMAVAIAAGLTLYLGLFPGHWVNMAKSAIQTMGR